MHIDVSDILSQETGYRSSFNIENERPKFEDVELAEPINGKIDLVRTDEGISSKGEARLSVELDCHRCLRKFQAPVEFTFQADFAHASQEDIWPISQDETIDLAPVMRQEILVSLPVKQVCKEGCLGICQICGEVQEDEPHRHGSKVEKKGN